MILAGCGGRMGQLTVKAAAENGIEIKAGIDFSMPESVSFPVFRSALEVPLVGEVFLDFSACRALSENLGYLRKNSTPAVFAVTGYSEGQKRAIRDYGRQAPVLLCSNFSPVAALLSRLSALCRRELAGYDAEIVEWHRKGKADAPSGTALELQKALGEAVPIHSIRAGNTPGEHEVLFAGGGETLSLCHHIDTPVVFAREALAACRWIIAQPKGLYTERDFFEPKRAEKAGYPLQTEDTPPLPSDMFPPLSR